MKKILTVVLLLVMAVACVACSQGKPANTAEKRYTYTIVNNTGKEVEKISLDDDNSINRADVAYEKGGLEDGGKATLTISAVPDKDGNPSLTASYIIDKAEYQIKVNSAAAEIRLTAEGAESGAFEVNETNH